MVQVEIIPYIEDKVGQINPGPSFASLFADLANNDRQTTDQCDS